jgi:hypothetical protein
MGCSGSSPTGGPERFTPSRSDGSAYIRSQAHDGWTLIRTRYDDGGYSGGRRRLR